MEPKNRTKSWDTTSVSRTTLTLLSTFALLVPLAPSVQAAAGKELSCDYHFKRVPQYYFGQECQEGLDLFTQALEQGRTACRAALEMKKNGESIAYQAAGPAKSGPSPCAESGSPTTCTAGCKDNIVSTASIVQAMAQNPLDSAIERYDGLFAKLSKVHRTSECNDAMNSITSQVHHLRKELKLTKEALIRPSSGAPSGSAVASASSGYGSAATASAFGAGVAAGAGGAAASASASGMNAASRAVDVVALGPPGSAPAGGASSTGAVIAGAAPPSAAPGSPQALPPSHQLPSASSSIIDPKTAHLPPAQQIPLAPGQRPAQQVLTSGSTAAAASSQSPPQGDASPELLSEVHKQFGRPDPEAQPANGGGASITGAASARAGDPADYDPRDFGVNHDTGSSQSRNTSGSANRQAAQGEGVLARGDDPVATAATASSDKGSRQALAAPSRTPSSDGDGNIARTETGARAGDRSPSGTTQGGAANPNIKLVSGGALYSGADDPDTRPDSMIGATIQPADQAKSEAGAASAASTNKNNPSNAASSTPKISKIVVAESGRYFLTKDKDGNGEFIGRFISVAGGKSELLAYRVNDTDREDIKKYGEAGFLEEVFKRRHKFKGAKFENLEQKQKTALANGSKFQRLFKELEGGDAPLEFDDDGDEKN